MGHGENLGVEAAGPWRPAFRTARNSTCGRVAVADELARVSANLFHGDHRRRRVATCDIHSLNKVYL